MVNLSNFLPALIRYGNVAYEYLRKHLTDDQICSYLDLLNTPSTTHGAAHKIITEEHGHHDKIFFALDSLGRINGLCNAAECPCDERIDSGRAFLVAFSALRAGMLIGAIVDDKGKKAILVLAKHGEKFANYTGRKPGKFTKLLEAIVTDYHQHNGYFPNYKEVLKILKRQANNYMSKGGRFIHTVDDDGSIEWGDKGMTSLPTLKNKLSDIRKKIKKNKITTTDKP
jgi:hypothetical protein